MQRLIICDVAKYKAQRHITQCKCKAPVPPKTKNKQKNAPVYFFIKYITYMDFRKYSYEEHTVQK
jgi:hypothetical protein